MSHWVLLVAPLALASFVMLFAFVGCALQRQGLGPGLPYSNDILGRDTAVSFWPLDEEPGSPTAVDSKGNNPGTYVGGVTLGQPSLVASDADAAAAFDGATGFVQVPFSDSLNPASFTVEAIAEVTGGDGNFRAVASSRDVDKNSQQTFGYILYANDQNKWEAWVGDGTVGGWHTVPGPDVAPGKHYLAMTYDGTTLKLYVDPMEETSFQQDVPYVQNAGQELRIGAGANEAEPLYFFDGVIDDVAVYNVALEFVPDIQSHFGLVTTGAG
jgi:Concanavalin A-like lectin/glucanases superfamily